MVLLYVSVALGAFFILFGCFQLIFFRHRMNGTYRIISSDEQDEDTGVSVIYHVTGPVPELEKNLESWFRQNYTGPVQHIFSFHDPDDPAIPVVQKVMAYHPETDCQITVDPIIPGLNGKSTGMACGMRLAKYDIVLFGDSDVRVRQDLLVRMVRPLKDEKVGMTTCAQVYTGGTDFWTRFFTFARNNVTDFIWAFLCRFGSTFGIAGAAFAMRKRLLAELGGPEAFGGSLPEEAHLGSRLHRMGYRLVLGSFAECHADIIDKEEAVGYAKMTAISVKARMAELSVFFLMLSWYWIIFILGFAFADPLVIYLSFIFISLRVVHGLIMRILTNNRVMLVDVVIPLFFDLFVTFWLLFPQNNTDIAWRGTRYSVRKGGFIEAVYWEDESGGSGKDRPDA